MQKCSILYSVILIQSSVKMPLKCSRVRCRILLLWSNWKKCFCFNDKKRGIPSTMSWRSKDLRRELVDLCILWRSEQKHQMIKSFKNVKMLIYDQPPVNLWKSSSLRVWLASFDRIERKMYPPINSCTTLQSADRQLNITFSSSNCTIMCFTSQFTFHA